MISPTDINPPRQMALEFVLNTNRNVFLTGNAGTGKTTFLQQLKTLGGKRMVVVAPTGVAAINAGGMTIHSFFQLSFGPQLPNAPEGNNSEGMHRFSRQKINIIRSLDLLVIDEISMVRADLLDAIDRVLRRYRNRNLPFGGVQLLMIGDLQQLAPVIKDGEWNLLKSWYDTQYFFSSLALKKTNYVGIELKHVYRQSDQTFIEMLNRVRNNNMDEFSLRLLNSRFKPGFKADDAEGYVTLTTHNYQARSINDARLMALPGPVSTFNALIEGDFPEQAWPTDNALQLKTGSQVMFIKNDPSQDKLFYNGKTGTLVDIDEDTLYVKCPGEESLLAVQPLEWQNTRYTLIESTAEIKETVIGSFTQYPLKLAWAITIHKSQGLTFEKVIIDAHAAFAHGQVYVALSRCRTLEGLVLSTSISPQVLTTDHQVNAFNKYVRENEPDKQLLLDARITYQRDLLDYLFDFKPLQYTLGRVHRLAVENRASLDQGLADIFDNMGHFIKNEMTVFAERFGREMDRLEGNNMEPCKNPQLQSRLQKASAYFNERIQNGILSVLDALDIDSDNKAVKKSMEESLQRFIQEVNIKKACLEACKKGFDVSSFLSARAQASIEKTSPAKARKPAGLTVKENCDHPQLMQSIRSWRDKIANDHNLAVARILPRRTILEIANLLPGNEEALLEIHGMGKKKVSLYGSDIIDLVKDYCQVKGLEPRQTAFNPFEAATPSKAIKTSTKEVSLEMFRMGLSVSEIASNRSLTTGTVEGHLTGFLQTGILTLDRLVSPEKAALITEYFHSCDDYHLTPAREVLGDEVSFIELRHVLNRLIYTRELDHKPSFQDFLASRKDSHQKND